MEERAIRSVIGEQKPIFASAEASVAAAAKLMKRHRIGALLVMKSGRLAGIFTERDALFRVLAEGRDPAKTHLSQVMTLNPRTISPDRPFGRNGARIQRHDLGKVGLRRVAALGEHAEQRVALGENAGEPAALHDQ